MTPTELDITQKLDIVHAATESGASYVSTLGQTVLQNTGCFRHSAFTMTMAFIEAVALIPKPVQDLMMASLDKPLPPTVFPEAVEQQAAVRDLIATAIRLYPLFHRPAIEAQETKERIAKHIEHMASIKRPEQN